MRQFSQKGGVYLGPDSRCIGQFDLVTGIGNAAVYGVIGMFKTGIQVVESNILTRRRKMGIGRKRQP